MKRNETLTIFYKIEYPDEVMISNFIKEVAEKPYSYTYMFDTDLKEIPLIKLLKETLEKEGKVEKVIYTVRSCSVYFKWKVQNKKIMIKAHIGISDLSPFAHPQVQLDIFSPSSILSFPPLFRFIKSIIKIHHKFKKNRKIKTEESPYFDITLEIKDYYERKKPTKSCYTIKVFKDYEKHYPLINYAPIRNSIIKFEKKLDKLLHGREMDSSVIILEGPPGTGKTYYIKRLLSIIHHKESPIIKYFIGEAALNLRFIDLLNFSKRDYGKRTILIMEDVDPLIFSEDGKRSIALSRLLNYSSGLLSLKVLFILTTNLSINKIDPALIRNGRLFAHIKFLPFSNEKDIREWMNFYGIQNRIKDVITKNKITLAELYSIAKSEKRISPIEAPPPIGFITI